MARFRVIISQEAERNVEETFQWIYDRSPSGAIRWHASLTKCIAVLADQPDRFAIAPESKHFDQTVRSVTFRMKSGRTYRLLFTIERGDVRILFVRGPGQDWVTP